MGKWSKPERGEMILLLCLLVSLRFGCMRFAGSRDSCLAYRGTIKDPVTCMYCEGAGSCVAVPVCDELNGIFPSWCLGSVIWISDASGTATQVSRDELASL